jgi:hypothetical protein
LGSSKVAVKVNKGSFADFLTPQERTALELLFSRFSDRSRFGLGYADESLPESDGNDLGNIVDVKV